MQLMSEEQGKRIYLGNDNETWYEIRAELRCQTGYAPKADLDANPEARITLQKEVEAQLHAWFAAHAPDDTEPFGEVRTRWTTEMLSWIPDSLDEEGNPIPFFAPYPVEVCWSERLYWPPAPVDPDPQRDEPMPRASDFRGDHKK